MKIHQQAASPRFWCSFTLRIWESNIFFDWLISLSWLRGDIAQKSLKQMRSGPSRKIARNVPWQNSDLFSATITYLNKKHGDTCFFYRKSNHLKTARNCITMLWAIYFVELPGCRTTFPLNAIGVKPITVPSFCLWYAEEPTIRAATTSRPRLCTFIS